MNLNNSMRIYHRYLGFFLAGIMAVYAISGIILIFRDTDFLKVEKKVEKELKPNLEAEELGKALRIRELQVTGTEGAIVSFAQGTYNKETGVAVYTTKELPLVLNKMTQLHKANTKQPLFFLNILFGLSLFFFVISSFWMFMPGTDVFKKGLYFAAAGLVIALLLIFIK
ncbi:MAG: hypothetical protein ACK5RG_06715 [Cyclobacteriaceae bacterium]|nr:hypothetical protein [Flammeovirgaceae bacterium]